MAALGSIGSALVLLGLKVFLAVATGSLGVLSEALHSGLDLIAAILTWLSVRVSDKPADSGHTYGHGKIESFSAFVETGLLLATSVYIIFEAFARLLFKRVELQPGESKTVEFSLDRSVFSYWSPQTRDWTIDPGTFEVQLGASSRDIRLKAPIEVK